MCEAVTCKRNEHAVNTTSSTHGFCATANMVWIPNPDHKMHMNSTCTYTCKLLSQTASSYITQMLISSHLEATSSYRSTLLGSLRTLMTSSIKIATADPKR